MFFGSDFITVTKTDGDWQQLKPIDPRRHHGALHVRRAAPDVRRGHRRGRSETNSSRTKDAETVATIKELIETRVRPAVANDGGDITFRGFKDGIVFLDMKGACAGCPSSTATLQARHSEPAAPFRARRGRGPSLGVTGVAPDRQQPGRLQRGQHDIGRGLFPPRPATLLTHVTPALLLIRHARTRHRYRPCGLLGCGARHRGRRDFGQRNACHDARPCRGDRCR